MTLRIEAPKEKLDRLRELQQKKRDRELARIRAWEPYPWQIMPDDVPPVGLWLMMGGRGVGKTDGAAHAMIDHVNGPPCDPRIPGGHRMAIIGPTLGDAVESCINGPSGLRSYAPDVKLRNRTGGTFAIFPNGSEAKIFGAYGPEDVERLRAGGNRCFVWGEEVATWVRLEDVWKQMRLGLRIGEHPIIVASTTPKPKKFIKELLGDDKTRTTHGITANAWHLAQEVRDQLYRDYAGTRLGRQELEGELIEEVEGALWSISQLDSLRVAEKPELTKIMIGVDPSGSAEGDLTGIVVVGRDRAGHVYVLEDASGQLAPHSWGRIVGELVYKWNADKVMAEGNYGGEMVRETLQAGGVNINIEVTHASVGKRPRAAPVAALAGDPTAPETWNGQRFHIVGSLPRLEEEITTWTPEDNTYSPGRLDALVWAVQGLGVLASDPVAAWLGYAEKRLAAQKR